MKEKKKTPDNETPAPAIDYQAEVHTYIDSIFKPISRDRFFEIATTFGLNQKAAADIWFCRPIDHMSDSEDVIIGNFKMMCVDGWAERMNAAANALERHVFEPDVTGQVCEHCKNRKYTPIHFIDPAAPAASIATTPRRQLN